MSGVDCVTLRRPGTEREALLKVWDGLRFPTRGPGLVGRPFWRSGMGREFCPAVRDRSRGHTRGPGWVM